MRRNKGEHYVRVNNGKRRTKYFVFSSLAGHCRRRRQSPLWSDEKSLTIGISFHQTATLAGWSETFLVLPISMPSECRYSVGVFMVILSG